MPSLEKIAQFLNSFEIADENYDYANYILQKLSELENLEQDNQQDNQQDQDIAELEPLSRDNQTEDNYEGNIMAGAFKDLEDSEDVSQEANKATEKINYVRAFLEKLKK